MNPASPFNPHSVDLDNVDPSLVVCYLSQEDMEDHAGALGLRISAIFVILVVSTAVTVFPVLVRRWANRTLSRLAYAFGRNCGTGVIIATAFIQCVAVTGHGNTRWSIANASQSASACIRSHWAGVLFRHAERLGWILVAAGNCYGVGHDGIPDGFCSRKGL